MIYNKEFFLKIILMGQCPFLGESINLNIDQLQLTKKIVFKDYNDGFLYYNKVRFSIEEDKICEYNIDFYKLPNLKLTIDLENINLNKICFTTKLHEFIRILKYLKIEYSEVKVSDIDYFIIQTKHKVNIYFDLESGNLYRIGKLFIEN